MTIPPSFGLPCPPGTSSSRSHDFLFTEVWAPGDRVFLGVPTFIPRQARQADSPSSGRSNGGGGGSSAAPAGPAAAAVAAEDDGYILVMLHNAETSRCVLGWAGVSVNHISLPAV